MTMYNPESYTATEDQKVFTFTFDLISAAYLTVSLNDTNQTDWTLTGPHEITFGASTTIDSGDVVAFSRTTPIDEPLVSFTAPSSIRGREINLAIEQLLHNLQETDAINTDGLTKNAAETAWDAKTLTISNLADPNSDDDAASRGWVQGQIVASGQLPPTGSADAGKLLGVNEAGSGYALLSPGSGSGGSAGAMSLTLDVDSAPAHNGQRGGQLSTPKNIGFIATRSDSIDLGESYKVSFLPPRTTSEFANAPTWDPSTQKLLLPSGGMYRLRYNGTAHNLLVSSQTNYTNSAVLQINNATTGQALAAQTIMGGRGESVNQAAADIHSGTYMLEAIADTSGGAMFVDMRFAHFHLGDIYALDVPAKLYVEEL